MGGVATPAVGFGLGIERLRSELEAIEFKPNKPKIDVFVAAIGSEGTLVAEVIREELLNAGFSVSANFTKKSIGDQLAIAAKQKSRYSVVVGEREAKQGEVILKDMNTGNQQNERREDLSDKLKELLKA